MKDRGYISIARTVLISAVSGLIAFGAAVLYLGGDDSEPSEPSLTRADVQSMIDDTPPALTLPSLTRADVQAMIDDIASEQIAQSRRLVSEWAYESFEAAGLYAICADGAFVQHRFDLQSGIHEDRAFSIYEDALDTCWMEALVLLSWVEIRRE